MPNITKHLDEKSYGIFCKQTSKQLVARIKQAEAQIFGFDLFEQRPENWFRFKDETKFEAAVALLKQPKNIETLLRQINTWIQTIAGSKRVVCWINVFGRHWII